MWVARPRITKATAPTDSATDSGNLQRIKVCGCGGCKKKALYFTSSSTYRQRQGLGTMASMTALVATTTPHCKASHRVVVSQAQARSFTPALQKPARSAARPALRLNSPRNVKTYAQDTETAAGELLAFNCHKGRLSCMRCRCTACMQISVSVVCAAGPVTDSTFEELVLKSPVPVLVDFWAPWCGPCRMIAPLVDELAVAFGDKIKAVRLPLPSCTWCYTLCHRDYAYLVCLACGHTIACSLSSKHLGMQKKLFLRL